MENNKHQGWSLGFETASRLDFDCLCLVSGKSGKVSSRTKFQTSPRQTSRSRLEAKNERLVSVSSAKASFTS